MLCNLEVKNINKYTCLIKRKYSLKTEAQDIKSADNKFKKIVSMIESEAKKEGMEFSVKEK